MLNLQGYSQANFKQPSWWFGVVGGANFNSYNGYTSQLNYDITLNPPLDKGHGVGAYFSALIEFHKPGTIWGVMLQQGFDSRRGNFENSAGRLQAKVSYLSSEPSIILMPKKIPIYFYAGPRIGFSISTGFTYKQPNFPEYPQKNRNPKAFIKNFDKIVFSAQAGVGYDLVVSPKDAREQFIISPFITYLPSLDQNLRTFETLKLNTLRAGIVLKVGRVLDSE